MERDEFRKYATKHLGMNGMVLDDVMKAQAQYLNPYILEEREMNVTQMSVFSRLFKDRILFLGTEVNSDSANILASQMMFLNSVDDTEDIKLYINSPGGSVNDGLGIFDVMNFIEPDVQTYCMGTCASMAAVLLSSGAEGKRFALPHGKIMIHQPSGGARGQATEIKIVAEHILKTRQKLNQILAENTGQSIERIEIDTERDNFMSAQEAKEYGSVDEVITSH